MATELFLAERTGTMRRFLRRFTYSSKGHCPAKPDRGHDAETVIDDVPEGDELTEGGDYLTGRRDGDWPHDDPRWPIHCQCGYAFSDNDHWQLGREALFAGPSGQFTLQEAPPGTMLRAPWFDGLAGASTTEQEAYLVILPDGNQWITTQHASNMDGTQSDRGWQVTGTPPKITVRPSIWANAPHGWHGFITEGVMEGV